MHVVSLGGVEVEEVEAVEASNCTWLLININDG
jgi:hypothetical protein